MYFSVTISMYQGTKMAFKNALLLGFLRSAKTSNLRALLSNPKGKCTSWQYFYIFVL